MVYKYICISILWALLEKLLYILSRRDRHWVKSRDAQESCTTGASVALLVASRWDEGKAHITGVPDLDTYLYTFYVRSHCTPSFLSNPTIFLPDFLSQSTENFSISSLLFISDLVLLKWLSSHSGPRSEVFFFRGFEELMKIFNSSYFLCMTVFFSIHNCSCGYFERMLSEGFTSNFLFSFSFSSAGS